jgi:phage terminase large subunit GpA-like protein
MMLYKASPMKHRMLADHLCSEQAIETAGRGRTLVEWQLLTGRDNHFLDCLVMCLVAASVVGVRTQADPQPVLQRPRKSLQQMRDEALNRRRE